VLCDEPTGAIDSRTGGVILALLESLNRDGATLLIVTHDASIARRAARVIRLRDGEVVADAAAPPAAPPGAAA
jgi:ABC-type lipoprotein export system ATPase subunit